MATGLGVSRIDVKASLRAAMRRLDELGGNSTKALVRGLNKALTSERAVFAREVAKDVGAKVSAVKDELKPRNATPKLTIARLKARGFRLGLIDLKARGPEPSRGAGGGVTAVVQGARKRYPHAFITTMRSGHRGVFQRAARGRLPIHELFGPSIARVFGRKIPGRLEQTSDTVLKKVKHEIEYEIMRLKAS